MWAVSFLLVRFPQLLQHGERGNGCRFGAQDAWTQSNTDETLRARGGDFFRGQSAFWTDQECDFTLRYRTSQPLRLGLIEEQLQFRRTFLEETAQAERRQHLRHLHSSRLFTGADGHLLPMPDAFVLA